MPKMTPNWSQRGSQNGAKIVKNEVLEAPCFKGVSQVASRPPPGSILERFWDHFGTMFVSFLSYFWCCLLAFLLLQIGARGSLVIEISNTADHVGTIFVSCSNIFIVILARILQQYVRNKNVQNHKESSRECSRELPRNNFSLRANLHWKAHQSTLMSFPVLASTGWDRTDVCCWDRTDVCCWDKTDV